MKQFCISPDNDVCDDVVWVIITLILVSSSQIDVDNHPLVSLCPSSPVHYHLTRLSELNKAKAATKGLTQFYVVEI